MQRVVIFNDTSIYGHAGCEIVIRQLRHELQNAGLHVADDLWPAWRSWPKQYKALNKIDCDLIVINGEGTLHDDQDPGRAYVRELLESASIARKRLKVPVALVNASISSLSESSLEHIASFDLVAVRDTASSVFLQSAGIESAVLCDLALLSKPLGLARRYPLVATDSVIGETTDMLTQFARLRSYKFVPFEGETGLASRFLRHVAYGTNRGSIRRFFSSSGSKIEKTLLSAEFILAGRYHAVALALREGIPFAAIDSNTDKIRWLLQDVFAADERLISEELLLSSWAGPGALGQFSSQEKTQLEAFLKRKSGETRAVFAQIAELL